MNWPTSQDYNEAIQNAASSFSDPALKNGEVAVNAIGLPVPRSGNFADVYQFKGGDGKTWALKCFTRKVAGLQERYAKIDEHIGKANFPFTVGFNYLAEGIRIRGQWFPVLKMEWIEGFTLNEFVRNNAGKPQYLHALMQMWAKLCARLRDGNFAHADLQHGNVLLVAGDAQNKLGLKLIDYDGMWVPSLADYHSGEIGHPNFQHPLRLKDKLYNGDVDRFPHLVIACALRATLLGGRALWDKFDNGDNLLFKEACLREPGNAKVFKALWDLNDDVLCVLLGKMALASKEPMRKTPWLDDVLLTEEGERLTDAEEKKVMDLLGVGPHFTASKSAVATAAPAAPAASEFADFEVLDDEEDKKAAVRRPGKTKKKPARAKGKAADDDNEPERKAKSFLPYYIGGGVAAAALLVGIIAMTAGGGKKDKPTEQDVVKNNNEDGRKGIISPVRKAGGDGPKVNEPPKNNTPKDPPTEVKKDPPVEVRKDPPVEVKNDPNVPVGVKAKTAVLGMFAVPPAKDILLLLKDDPLLQRYNYEQKTTSLVGKHDGVIRAVAVASNGGQAVSGGDDNVLRVWSLNPPRQQHVLPEHTQPIVACAISPDNQRAVSIGTDRLLCEWDIKEGKLIRKFEVPASLAVAYLPDGKTVLLGTKSESAALFDLEKREKVKVLPGHQGNVNAVCVANQGKYGFTAGADRVIRVWNLATGEQVNTLDKHSAPVLNLAASPDGRIVVSAGADNQVYMWRSGSGILGGSFPSRLPLRSAIITGSGEDLVLGSGDDAGAGAAWFLHLNITGKPPVEVAKNGPIDDPQVIVKELWNGPAFGGQFSFTGDGAKIAVRVGTDLRLYDASNGAQVDTWKFDFGNIQRFAVCSDGTVVTVRVRPKMPFRLISHNPKTGTGFEVENEDLTGFSFAVVEKDGIILAPLRPSGIGVFSLKDGKKIEHLAFSNLQFYSIACSQNGEAILAGTSGPVYFRAAKDQPFRQIAFLKAMGFITPQPRLSPDGKHFMHYDGGQSIYIYETTTGKQIAVLEGHAGRVEHADFLADGRRVLSLGNDNTLRVWDLTNAREIKRIDLPPGKGYTQLAVSPDRQLVYSVRAMERKLEGRLWRVSLGAATAKAPDPDPKIVKKDLPPDGPAPQLKEIAKIDHKLGNFGLALSNDGSRLFVAPQALPQVRIYKTSDGALLDTLTTTYPPWSITALPADDAIAIGSGLKVQLLNVVTKQGLNVNYDGKGVHFVKKMATDVKNKLIFVPDGNGWICSHGLADGVRVGKFRLPVADQIIAASCSQDGNEAIVLTNRGNLLAKPAGATEFKLLGNFPRALTAELSPDGKQFMVAYDPNLTVYDAANGKEILPFDGRPGAIRFACYVNGGRQAISVHSNGSLRLWDAQTGKLIQKIDLPGAGVHVAVSADGRTVAAAVNNPDVIQIWRLESGSAPPTDPKIVKKEDPKTDPEGPVATSADLSDRIVDCFYSSNGKKIYAAASSGAVHVLDPLTLKEIAKYNAIDGRIMHVVAAPKSASTKADRSKEWLYILDDQKNVHVFDSEKTAVVKKLPFEAQMNDRNVPHQYSMTVTPDAQFLLFSNRAGFRRVIWNLRNNMDGALAPLEKFPFKTNVHWVAFSADARFGTAYAGSKILVWNAKTGFDVNGFDCPFVTHLALVPEANTIVATGRDFIAWNFLTGKEIWNEKAAPFSGGLTALPKSKRIAYVSGGELIVRDCVKGDDLQRWKLSDRQSNLTASSDGKYVVSFGRADRKVLLWSVPAIAAKKP